MGCNLVTGRTAGGGGSKKVGVYARTDDRVSDHAAVPAEVVVRDEVVILVGGVIVRVAVANARKNATIRSAEIARAANNEIPTGGGESEEGTR